MLWEHEPRASVSTAFSSSPKLSLHRNTDNMFSISFRKHRDEEKECNFLFARAIITSTARASSVSPSSYI